MRLDGRALCNVQNIWKNEEKKNSKICEIQLIHL